MARQVTEVVTHFPDYLTDAQAYVQVAARFGQGRTSGWTPSRSAVAGRRGQPPDGDPVPDRARSVTSVISGLIIFVIGPVMAFYLLVDLPRLERGRWP